MPGELAPELLESVLVRTLEEAAFVFLEGAEAPWDPAASLIEATLECAAGRRAELRLTTTESFAATLAANMLGEEEGGADLTGDDEDAIGELLNMIAGSIAAEVFGRQVRCTLGIPRIRRVTVDEHRAAVTAAEAVAAMTDGEGHGVQLSARWIGTRS